MTRRWRRRLSSAALVFVAACGKAGPDEVAPESGGRRDQLTQEQLQGQSFPSVYEAVAALRPPWLQGRGTDSFFTPSQVMVYMDANRLGGIEALRSIPIASVVVIQHFDGIAATARWGTGHSHGVIQVLTTR